MKKPVRKSNTGNPGKKKPRGSAPEDRPGGWLRWLDREIDALFGWSVGFQKFVWLLVLLVFGAVVWVWRAFSA